MIVSKVSIWIGLDGGPRVNAANPALIAALMSGGATEAEAVETVGRRAFDSAGGTDFAVVDRSAVDALGAEPTVEQYRALA